MEISQHFTYKKLIRFVIPSVVMMVFTSIYGVVDGLFVSNYAGKTAFAGLNLTMPFIMFVSVAGFMVGTGGNAIVSKTFGEGNNKKANEIFSMLIAVVIIFGIVITTLAQIFLKPIVIRLGADDEMLPYCMIYGRVTLCSVTFFMLQNVFQSLLVTAGKPKIGLFFTLTAGIANMILDFLFVGIFGWSITGAAAATVTSEFLGGGLPLIYFIGKNKSTLRFTRHFKFDAKVLLKTCTNGASELMTNVSMSLVNMLYNGQLMRFYGQDGVAAYGSIMYVNFIFVSALIGYSIGVAPIIGYNYGAENKTELHSIFSKSIKTVATLSIMLTASAMALCVPIAKMFTGYDEGLFSLTKMAFALFATSYLICGFNIFSSAFFTALSNGGISATISFSRTLLFQIVMIFLLPALFGADSIWLSITVSEFATLVVTVAFFATQKKKYGY